MAASLHLMKLAVGVEDVAHLARLQAARLALDPPLRHLTRHLPRRREAIIAGGSIYWVIAGLFGARQLVRDIIPARRADGAPAAALLLDPALVALDPRPMAAFQGWRYLAPEAAPADLGASAQALPAGLARDLRRLGLL